MSLSTYDNITCIYTGSQSSTHNEINDGHPRLPVVDIISKSRRVNDRQFHLELFLLQLCLDDIFTTRHNMSTTSTEDPLRRTE